jgi:two-component system sensor histidine kinase BaeS
MVFGDRDRLMQLFNNLLENSLRYTDSGGRLLISASQTGRRIILDFADSAPGVSDQQLETLLSCRRFAQPRQRRLRTGAGDLPQHRGGPRRHLTCRPFAFGGVSIKVELPLERDLPRDV